MNWLGQRCQGPEKHQGRKLFARLFRSAFWFLKNAGGLGGAPVRACARLCLARYTLRVFLGLSTLFTSDVLSRQPPGKMKSSLGAGRSGFAWVSFWCLAWDSRQIFYSLKRRSCSGPGALTEKFSFVLPPNLLPLQASWSLSVQFPFFWLLGLGGSVLSPGALLLRLRHRWTGLRPECAGPFSLRPHLAFGGGRLAGWRVHGEATFSRRLAWY